MEKAKRAKERLESLEALERLARIASGGAPDAFYLVASRAGDTEAARLPARLWRRLEGLLKSEIQELEKEIEGL